MHRHTRVLGFTRTDLFHARTPSLMAATDRGEDGRGPEREMMASAKEADSDGIHRDRLLRAQSFCKSVYGVRPSLSTGKEVQRLSNLHDDRARLTLTFAQSNDGKIAGVGKRMLALSNADSMIMTHTIRTLHDAILVGVGTACNDNPQLNARLLNPLLDHSDVPLSWLPRPVVIDGSLRTPLDSKLLLNYKSGKGKQPLILTSISANDVRAKDLQERGAELAFMSGDDKGRLHWADILKSLKVDHGLESVMIEGGATVIGDILSAHKQEPMVDDLIVTIAPCTVGSEGLAYPRPSWLAIEAKAETNSSLPNLSVHAFNGDTVAVWQSH